LLNLFESYLESTKEFSLMLAERSPAEVAYDNEVLAGLRNGLSIDKALEIAARKYPDEALKVDTNTIGEVNDHYQYLKNHEDILSKLNKASPNRTNRRRTHQGRTPKRSF